MVLKRYNKGKWISYPKAPGVEFLIKPLHLSDSLKIRNEVRTSVVKEVMEPKSKKMVSTLMEDVNVGSFSFQSFIEMLSDFRGPLSIEDEDGKETKLIEGMNLLEEKRIKKEIKLALFDDEDVRDFVAEQSELLLEQEKEVNKIETKNLTSLQVG